MSRPRQKPFEPVYDVCPRASPSRPRASRIADGAEAARRLGLSTQVPTVPVFHTSASSRSIRISNITVRMIHTSNRRRLQFAGETAGLALSALWYLGKDNVTAETVAAIESTVGAEEFEKLRSADVPAWMATALNASARNTVHG